MSYKVVVVYKLNPMQRNCICMHKSTYYYNYYYTPEASEGKSTLPWFVIFDWYLLVDVIALNWYNSKKYLHILSSKFFYYDTPCHPFTDPSLKSAYTTTVYDTSSLGR